jgi:3-deoxy-D-manno-octulosonic-acid transferase
MVVLYSIAIRFYGLMIFLFSPFNKKAKEWISGRKKQKWSAVPKGVRVVWFHCASLGEFDQGLPVMEEWKKRNPSDYILVTFFSPSGMLHYQKRKHPADQVVYLNLDTRRNAQAFIDFFKPKAAFIVKYEFWHHHLQAAKEFGTQLFSISTLLRPNQIYFKWYGSFFANTLRLIDSYFVQNDQTLSLLKGLGITQVEITGDNRFDRVVSNASFAAENTIIASFKRNEPILIIGSSWSVDDKILLPFVNRISWKVIIAPHQIEDDYILRICGQINRTTIRYSESSPEVPMNAEILILDTIGHLSSAYRYGDIAYVGGGFTGKLHNILEPAVFGLPVLFGPKHDRFPEAEQFLKEGIGFEVNSSEELEKVFTKISDQKETIQEKSIAFVQCNTGASVRILDAINSSSTI